MVAGAPRFLHQNVFTRSKVLVLVNIGKRDVSNKWDAINGLFTEFSFGVLDKVHETSLNQWDFLERFYGTFMMGRDYHFR